MALLGLLLANRVLEGEDPKEFLRRISAQKRDDIRRQGKKHVEPVEEWPEYEDLEEWQQVAVRELQDAENSYFAFHGDLSNEKIQVINREDDWFTIYQDDGAARLEAVDQVKQDLENEPELFTQTWLENFIDLENLRRVLHSDARDDDYWNDDNPDYESKLDKLIEQDIYSDDPRNDTDGEITPELESEIDEKWEEMIENFATQRMEDPVDYLADIYGRDDAVKKAIEFGGIDYDAAAESAVQTDGWQRILARHDGQSHDLPSGAVYIRQ